jgi:hypothetical protein
MPKYRIIRRSEAEPDIEVEADFVGNTSGFVRFEKRAPKGGTMAPHVLVRQIRATEVKEVVLIEDESE